MIAVWIGYSVVISAALYFVAGGMEEIARSLRLPTRFAWFAAVVAALALSGLVLWHPAEPVADPMVAGAGVLPKATTNDPSGRRPPSSVVRAAPASMRSVIQSRTAPLSRFDRPLGIALIVLAILGVGRVLLSVVRLNGLARGLVPHRMGNTDVLLSDDLGPALIGVIRPRALIPRWLLTLNASDQQLILEHERSHADARDPMLLVAGALLSSVTPWNPAVWLLAQRLRLAIELDCDQRVIGKHGDRVRYGRLLVSVHKRSVGALEPAVGFLARPSHLQSRIQRMISTPPSLRTARGAGAILALAAGIAVACGMPKPTAALNADGAIDGSIVGVLPRCWHSQVATPSVDELRSESVARHPAAFAPGRPGGLTVIGLVFDENCAVVGDTVMEYAGVERGIYPRGIEGEEQLFAAAFPKLGSKVRVGRGIAVLGAAGNSPRVLVSYAVIASDSWTKRIAGVRCGFALRSNDVCITRGEVAIRLVDSVRIAIAIRRPGAAGASADELFLVTLQHPHAAVASEQLPHALIMYQTGALYIENLVTTDPPLFFAASLAPTLKEQKAKVEVRSVTTSSASHTTPPLVSHSSNSGHRSLSGNAPRATAPVSDLATNGFAFRRNVTCREDAAERATYARPVASSWPMISSVVPVSPSRGKMRVILLA